MPSFQCCLGEAAGRVLPFRATHLQSRGMLAISILAAIHRRGPSLAHSAHRRALAVERRKSHDSLRQNAVRLSAAVPDLTRRLRSSFPRLQRP